jgi:hypothetical protein
MNISECLVLIFFVAEIQFGSCVHMLPPPKKHISNSQKILPKKIAYTSRQSICFHRVSRKTDIFYGRCKKDKTSLTKALSLALNFVFLHNPNDKLIFDAKTLCTLSIGRCTHELFV